VVVDLPDISECKPSNNILIARRTIEGIKSIELIDDLTWDSLYKKWVLLCRLAPDIMENEHVPLITAWYVHIPSTYPWGEIKFYPAKDKGIKVTFPHQNNNGVGEKGVPWSKGFLCLDTSTKVLGREGYDIEPFETETRLVWHFKRALTWLEAASRNELLLPDEPFEIPHFPIGSLSLVAFSENPITFSVWEKCKENYGIVRFVQLKRNPRVLLTKAFKTTREQVILDIKYGKMVDELVIKGSELGVWLRLTHVPILSPWQAPITWADLKKVCKVQGIDILDVIKDVSTFLRDGQAHMMLLGFPIPEKVGEKPRQMFWQAFRLPILSYGKKVAKGFRPQTGYWHRDKTEVIVDKDEVIWITSQNIFWNELLQRGGLPSVVTMTKVLLIGAGAVGAVVAENLVRAGLKNLTIIDEDRFELGNLVRHTLTMQDVSNNKALALAKRLNSCFPHCNVQEIVHEFPPGEDEEIEAIDSHSVILDCTGDDEVLYFLSVFPWANPKNFISVSLGLGGRRLFLFTIKSEHFPHEKFTEVVQPWLQKELVMYSSEGLPREGIGCWHPIFPARIDDVWMMSSMAVKYIERFIRNPNGKPTFLVLEQQWEADVFKGVELVCWDEYND
jgi:hypothetical protein